MGDQLERGRTYMSRFVTANDYDGRSIFVVEISY